MPSEANSPTVRAGAYARYSSDHQRDASVDDQIRICRVEIERNGWDLVEIYVDAGISGASTFRPGYKTLVQDASAGVLDIVIAESLDRLSRDLADVATLLQAPGVPGRPAVDRGRGADRRAARRVQGHDERAVPEGPRPEDAPRRAGAQRHLGRRDLLRLRLGARAGRNGRTATPAARREARSRCGTGSSSVKAGT